MTASCSEAAVKFILAVISVPLTVPMRPVPKVSSLGRVLLMLSIWSLGIKSAASILMSPIELVADAMRPVRLKVSKS